MSKEILEASLEAQQYMQSLSGKEHAITFHMTQTYIYLSIGLHILKWK
uniref:Uncharacterized protein n=1 Tax=Arundo donax TaxID=35708 RepID=A0A0A9G209_ARUDO